MLKYFFRGMGLMTPTPVESAKEQLKEARLKLLNARTNQHFYANEVVYQEGLIALLERQLQDETITKKDWANGNPPPAPPFPRQPTPDPVRL